MQSSKAPYYCELPEGGGFFLLPPSRGKVGMGVKCVGLCPPFTLRPPTSPSPFQGEGNTFLRPSHRACPRESGGQTWVGPPGRAGGLPQ